MSRVVILAVAVLALSVVAVPDTASAIPITNASFEFPATSSTANSIDGWTISGNGAGVWNINASPSGFWTTTAPDGSQIAFVSRTDLNAGALPATISQKLGVNVVPNSIYFLSGYVGHPKGFGAGTTFIAELLAGGIPLIPVAAGGAIGTGPEETLTPFSRSFDSTGSSGELEIRLTSSKAQTGFDLISLDVSPVPEPSTLLLLGAGLLGLGGRAWRKRRMR